ncbi:class II fructose-bisphosphate aldolase, partial [Bacillus altitudinis]|uniref:class II fructose-bisphosphate aldolase n=1 Tax=Bacillus altitudinis TaxID=293387 RepID=UPI003B51839A
MLQLSQQPPPYIRRFKTLLAILKPLIQQYNLTLPLPIHLHHPSTFQSSPKPIHPAFTSVMIHPSHHPFHHNVPTTPKLVEL